MSALLGALMRTLAARCMPRKAQPGPAVRTLAPCCPTREVQLWPSMPTLATRRMEREAQPRRAIAALTALLLTSITPAAHADDPRSSSNSKLKASKGAEVYTHVCQACHMPTAQGAMGAGAYPKLAANPSLASWQFIAVTILNGRNAMPPFGTPAGIEVANNRVALLTDAQIADVVNYVRSQFGNHYKEKITPEQVASLPHPAAASLF